MCYICFDGQEVLATFGSCLGPDAEVPSTKAKIIPFLEVYVDGDTKTQHWEAVGGNREQEGNRNWLFWKTREMWQIRVADRGREEKTGK